MKLLKSLFVKQKMSDICLGKESLDLLLKGGGLTYIKEIQSSSNEIISKVKTMLENDKEYFKSGKIVLIHFCVRPSVSFEIINELSELVNEYLSDAVDVFWGIETKKYKLDSLTFGIMIGGIEK